MTALLIAAAVLAVFMLILIIEVSAEFRYSAEGFEAAGKIGPVRIKIYPKEKKDEKKAKKAKEKSPSLKGGDPELIKSLLPQILSLFSDMTTKLVIEKLTVVYVSSSEDPAAAAMNFGKASAFFGVIIPLLENCFILRERDFRASVDFTAKTSTVYASGEMSIKIYQILIIFLRHGMKIIKTVNDNSKTKDRKAEQ